VPRFEGSRQISRGFRPALVAGCNALSYKVLMEGTFSLLDFSGYLAARAIARRGNDIYVNDTTTR
jgi:hypothetical protein